MSGIIGSRLNIRGSGVVGSLGTDGQILTSAGAGQEIVFESVSGAAVTALNNATQSELVTVGSTTTELDAEANLTFTGSALTCIGTMTIGVNDTGHDVKFFGATSGSYWLWDEDADGVVQIGTLTVGVNDAGHDVKFFGNAASAYMLWDTSADDLILAGAAGLSVAGATATAAITASGIIKTDDTTAATSTTDGSLQTDGGLSVALDAIIGDDITLISDAAVLGFGANKDVTLTHVHDTGILLNSTMAIQFNDASQYINAPSNAILDINATDEIELNATLVDINANVEISGTATTTGVHTFTAVPVFPNNTVESADIQADAITGAKIADDAIDSEHYTDGSIDNAHIADDAIDSEHYADGSIDNAHIADDAIDSEHYAAGSIDTAHIADNQITLAKMAGGTDGNIISFDASGDPVAIATGSDGQVLTSTGAGSPPAFETASSGTITTITSDQGIVGTYGFMWQGHTTYQYGSSIAGSRLEAAGAGGQRNNNYPQTGTWQTMGYSLDDQDADKTCLFVRTA